MSFADPDGPAGPADGLFGCEVSEGQARVVVLAMPYEATVSYRSGAARGPDAILTASSQLDLFDVELGRIYEAGIALRRAPAWLRELGPAARRDALCSLSPTTTPAEADACRRRVDRAGERIRDELGRTTRSLLEVDRLVGVVGGDHSVPLGSIIAHADRYPGLGILHVDAHMDLRAGYEGFRYSHASIMERVLCEAPGVARIVQVGIRDFAESERQRAEEAGDRVQIFYDLDLAESRLRGQLLDRFERVVEALPHEVYLSIDIDGLDPKLCPLTGTPVPGGLELNELFLLFRAVVRSGRRIVGFDLCEVAGPSDGTADAWDGNVGARLLYRMIGYALASGGRS